MSDIEGLAGCRAYVQHTDMLLADLDVPAKALKRGICDRHELKPSQIEAIREQLLDWYSKSQREMPWRHGYVPFLVWCVQDL